MSSMTKRLTAITLSCLIAWTAWPGSSQASATSGQPLTPNVEWSSTYGNNAAYSAGKSVSATPDGGYVAAGNIIEESPSGYWTEQKGYIVKVDENGTIQWEQTLQIAPDDDSKEGVSALHVIPTGDGGYFVSGTTTDRTSRPATVPYLAKLDNLGNIEWSGAYDDFPGGNHNAESAVETPDGGFVVTGYSANVAGVASAFLLKVDQAGNQVWFKRYRFGENQFFNEVLNTPDGGFLAVGRVDDVMSSDYDASLIIKLDLDGEIEWEKQELIPKSGRTAYSAQLAQDGNYMVAGTMRKDGQQAVFVLKADTSGNTIWEKTFTPEDGSFILNQLSVTSDGYALIGSHSTGSYPNTHRQYQIYRLNADGEVTANLRFEGPGLTSAGKGTVTADGGFLMTGQIKVNDVSRMQLIKVSGEGQETPPIQLTRIRFTDPAQELGIGEYKTSVVEAVYTDGSTTEITNQSVLISLNPEVATVNTTGVLKGLAPGTTEIVAEFGGYTASLPVTVTDVPTETPGRFYLDSEDYSLSVGSELDIQALFTDASGNTSIVNDETRFTIADPEIAEIDNHGMITGLKRGITTVTANYKGQTFTASLLVVNPYVPPGLADEQQRQIPETPGLSDELETPLFEAPMVPDNDATSADPQPEPEAQN